MSLNPIRAATLAVADLPAAIARYETWLDYRVIEKGGLDDGVAASLAAPAAADAACVVMRPSSGRAVDLRLVEQPPVANYQAMRSYGWAALEICIENVHAIHARMLDAPFEVIGPPAPISALPTIHPMQVEGPDGEVIFLTEIKQGGPGSGLPTAGAPIDTLFIAVLACRDLAAMAAWASERVGASVEPPIEIPYRTINRAFGLPATTPHSLATATRDGHIFLELDRYPEATVERRGVAGWLPPGVSVISLLHPDLDTVSGPWMSPPSRREGMIYEGRRVGVLRMPEGALIELIEAKA